MSSRIPIGLSGVAGAGKDLFFSLLSKKMPARRFALADKLKWETSTWCYDQYDIDPLECTREQKEELREFLVYHGSFKRRLSNGRYWIDKLDPNVKGFLLNAQTDDVPVVTDIRYDHYEKDEVFWVKNELNGVLVHISQYHTPEHGRPEEKYERLPANREEQSMDPIIKAKSDFLVNWRKIKCDNPLESDYLNNKVDNFVEWYNEKIKSRAENSEE
jgi:hypothetical protein